jgi:hypothetical protein
MKLTISTVLALLAASPLITALPTAHIIDTDSSNSLQDTASDKAAAILPDIIEDAKIAALLDDLPVVKRDLHGDDLSDEDKAALLLFPPIGPVFGRPPIIYNPRPNFKPQPWKPKPKRSLHEEDLSDEDKAAMRLLPPPWFGFPPRPWQPRPWQPRPKPKRSLHEEDLSDEDKAAMTLLPPWPRPIFGRPPFFKPRPWKPLRPMPKRALHEYDVDDEAKVAAIVQNFPKRPPSNINTFLRFKSCNIGHYKGCYWNTGYPRGFSRGG